MPWRWRGDRRGVPVDEVRASTDGGERVVSRAISDRHGNPAVLVAVRVGDTWTDSVAIEGEDRTVAMRHRTHGDSALIVPSELGSERSAVWRRDGRCEDVLAELLELPTG